MSTHSSLSEESTLSTPRTLTLLTEGMNQIISNGTITSAEYRRLAFADLHTLALVPEEKRRIWGTQVDSSKVLSAMLEHAPTDRGVRYVSSAILSCEKQLDRWVGLASDWLEFLLLPFKTSYKENYKPLSLSSTSTISPTPAKVSVIPTQRRSDFETDAPPRRRVCSDGHGARGRSVYSRAYSEEIDRQRKQLKGRHTSISNCNLGYTPRLRGSV